MRRAAKTEPAEKGLASKVLLSRQWQSESSLLARVSDDPEADGSGSGSSDSPDPCIQCHIDFLKPEISVNWKDLTYGAAGNLDPSHGGWTPDKWSVSGTATIDDSGTVTFGPDGETVTVTASVKQCPNCSNSFTLNILRLRILYEGNDVTGARTNVEVGNLIPLNANITPNSFQPAGDDYVWVIPPNVLKNYIHTAPANPLVELTSHDRSKGALSFHWVDGAEKECAVLVTVKGVVLEAQSTFDVSRPTASIAGEATTQPSINNGEPGNPKAWNLHCTVNFTLTAFAGGTGVTCWTQMFDYVKSLHMQGTIRLREWPKGSDNGLDTEFTYESGLAAEDNPQTGSARNFPTWIQYDGDLTMYLMYLSAKAGSRWVPLRSIFWQFRMRASTKKPNTPKANYKVDASSFLYVSPTDTNNDSPPNWKRILNPHEA